MANTEKLPIVKAKVVHPQKRSFKSLLIALLVGAIGGAIGAYHAENEETKDQLDYISDEYMEKTLKRWMPEINRLNQEFLDSKAKLQEAYSDIKEQNKIVQNLRDSIYDLQSYNSRCNENFSGYKQAFEEKDSQYKVCEDKVDSLTKDTLVLNKEIRIRDDQLDSLDTKLSQLKVNRYTMSLEFDLLTLCIYGDNSSYMYKSTYNQRKNCCIEQIQKIQKEYPHIKDFEKIAEQWEPKLNCNTNNNSDLYY